MKRILLLATTALVMAATMVAMARPALADKGGVPNERACHGQVVKTENRIGTTPHEGVAQLGLNNAGELNKLVKIGVVISEEPNAPNCPLGGF